jgi:RNA polymerase sigma-70 factor (ECF subfamily)
MEERPMADVGTTQIQGWIERMNAGDQAAREALLTHVCGRLRRLTRKVLQDFRRVHNWEETDDVLQNALVRLLRTLEKAKPASVAEFFKLAAREIRRELLDLVRHYYGPQGMGANQVATPDSDSSPRLAAEQSTTTHEPSRLAMWRELHEQVERLPDEEREVFDLVWYQGLTQAEAAAVLKVAPVTIKRRWLAARLQLQEALHGDLP